MEILTIGSIKDIKIAVSLLNVPEFSKIFLLCCPIPLQRERPGFATLFKVVIGLSRPKIRYAHILSRNLIDFDNLILLPDAEVLDIITQITEIGRWTAEVYALTALGRTDVCIWRSSTAGSHPFDLQFACAT